MLVSAYMVVQERRTLGQHASYSMGDQTDEQGGLPVHPRPAHVCAVYSGTTQRQ